MIVSSVTLTPTILTIGLFNSSKSYFRSDTDLTGQVVRYSPALFKNSDTQETGITPAYQGAYPANGVTEELTNLGHYNYKAFIKAIDEYNYCITIDYIVGSSSGGFSLSSQALNTTLLTNGSYNGFIGHYTKVGADESFAFQAVTVEPNECGFDVELVSNNITGGYLAGQDLVINLSYPDTIENNFEVGFYSKNIVNNTDVFDGLGLSYAMINSSVVNVLDSGGNNIPNPCIKAGTGFSSINGISTAAITIEGNCLNTGDYCAYIIYKKDGKRYSCQLGTISEGSLSLNSATITSIISDSFGNTSNGNVTGVNPCAPLEVRAILDTVSLDTILSPLRTTFDDSFVSLSITESNQESGNFGVVLANEGDDTDAFVNYTPSSTFEGDKYIVFLWELNIDGQSCFLRHISKITYTNNSITQPYTLTADGQPTDVICNDLGEYVITDNLDPSCLPFYSANGNTYVEGEVTPSALPEGEVCVKKICANVDTMDCECGECGTREVWVRVVEGNTSNFVQIRAIQGDGINDEITLTVTHNNTQTVLQGPGNIDWNSLDCGVVTPGAPCVISYEITAAQSADGCQYGSTGQTVVVTSQLQNLKNSIPSATDCIDCPEEPTMLDCQNSANIDFECDNGTITINTVTDYNSTPTSEELLCSIDGGSTYMPCPATIVGEASVIVILSVQFDDGCELEVNQTIECEEDTVCGGTIQLLSDVDDDCLLQLTWAETIDPASVLSDITVIDGEVFNPTSSYTPIQLSGEGTVNLERTVIFNNGCNDLVFPIAIPYDCSLISTGDCDLCDNYSFTLTVDENASTVSWSLNGDQSIINGSSVYFAWNEGNPLKSDSNGIYCGMPTNLTGTKKGKGQFAIGAILNIQGCSNPCYIFADAYIEGTTMIEADPCSPIPIIDCTPSPGEETKVELPK